MNNGNGNSNAVTVTECVVCGNPSHGKRYCSNACKMRNYRQSNGKLLSIRRNVTDNEDSNTVPEEEQQQPVKQSSKWRTQVTEEDWQDQEILTKLGMTGWAIHYILFFKNVSGLTGNHLGKWVRDIASYCERETLWEALRDESTYTGRAFKEFLIQYFKPK